MATDCAQCPAGSPSVYDVEQWDCCIPFRWRHVSAVGGGIGSGEEDWNAGADEFAGTFLSGVDLRCDEEIVRRQRGCAHPGANQRWVAQDPGPVPDGCSGVL